jgi:hypothetical protein
LASKRRITYQAAIAPEGDAVSTGDHLDHTTLVLDAEGGDHAEASAGEQQDGGGDRPEAAFDTGHEDDHGQ